MQRSSRAVAASKRNRTKKKGKAAVYLRLFLCIAIIGAAVVLKHVNMPITEKLIQVVSDELKVDEAIDVISEVQGLGNGITEVFGEGAKPAEEADNTEPVFGEDFYIGQESEELQKEIEENKKKAEIAEKELSVETLSFQMSEEELSDNTKAEVFRIPPPSYCSYDKQEIKFRYKAPLYGVITSKFGYRDHPIVEDASFHTGLDIAAKSGSAIGAFADGTVIDAGKNATYGNYLLIEHSGGFRSFYGHNSKLKVKKGQRVKLGQKVAEVGSTGMSTGPHLHFEVRKGNVRLDPALYISPETV